MMQIFTASALHGVVNHQGAKMGIVAVVGEKGGTGKTTIATNLSALLARAGKDVLLVDTDTQRSASYWTATRANTDFPKVRCVQLYEPSFGSEIENLATRYDEVVIDAGGRDSAELRRAILVAKKILIPVQPAQFDVWTVANLNDQLQRARILNPEMEARVVLSRAHTHPNAKDVEDVREALSDYDQLPISTSIIRDRILFKKAAREGLSVVEMPNADPKAVEEIEKLYREIYDVR